MGLGEWIRDELERGRREALDAMSIERLRELWDTLPDDGGPKLVGDLIVDCDDICSAWSQTPKAQK